MIHVLMVDDHPISRFGLRGLLNDEKDIAVVGEAANGREAIAAYEMLKPSVVVMDMQMRDMTGAEVTRALIMKDQEARVLVLSSYSTEHDVREALRAGALGYLMKESGAEEVLAAIRAVANGARFLSPVLERRLASTPEGSLTHREQQLLKHLFDGQTSRQIAESLGLTEGTVSVYLTRLYAKLGANSRTDAIAIGISRGFLPGR